MRTVLPHWRSRAMPAAWWLVSLCLAALAAGGCTSMGLAPPSKPGFVRCVNADSDYSIAYPPDWKANTTGRLEPCRFFHPTDFTVQPGTEEPPLAVSVKRESLSLGEFIQGNTGPGNEVLQQESVTIAGQPAVRLELRTTDQSALLPPGVREYVYAVTAGGNTLVRVGTIEAPGLDYERNKDVVDQMARTLILR